LDSTTLANEPWTNVDLAEDMPEEVASQAWDNWEPFGNYMYERKAAPRIPQQVNMDLIRHYMQEGLEPGEAY